MYWITGADRKEYGPINIDQIREWIAQGRINHSTQVRADGSDLWKPINTYPELSPLLAAIPLSPPPLPGNLMPPVTGISEKSKIAAGLLGIFLGSIGIHRFYLGYTTIGVIQIVVTVCTIGIGGLWGFIEGIMIIAGVGITTDAFGRPLRE